MEEQALADGTGQRQLTVETVEPSIDIYHYRPAWSPDGTKIAFFKGNFGNPSASGIYVIGPDAPGSGALLISGGDWPSWSPDGTQIVFSTGNIKVADANSGTVTATLTSGSAPCWSPYGSKIVFSKWDDVLMRYIIWVMNADGSRLIPLNVPGEQPSWSPDGTKIVFSRRRRIVLPSSHDYLSDYSSEIVRGDMQNDDPRNKRQDGFHRSHIAYLTSSLSANRGYAPCRLRLGEPVN
jgi:Tol biopolymer transport system component